VGCDIHTILQIKEDGIWKTKLRNIFSARDYDFFAWLSGVRGTSQTDPIARYDWPKDLTWDRRMWVEGDSGSCEECGEPIRCIDGLYMGEHSFGWVTAEEFINNPVKDTYDDEEGDTSLISAIDYQDCLRTLLRSSYISFGDCRLIFGYDS
jgi:hypothetical protein